MKLNKALLTAVAAAMVSLSANAAHVVINDWTFDATGIDGVTAGNAVVNDVSYLGFQAVYHSVLAAPAAVGVAFSVDAVGVITSFHDLGGTPISPVLFNSVASLGRLDGWELSFEFNTKGKFTSANMDGTFGFNHTAGTLDFYVNSLPGGSPAGTQCAAAVSQASCKNGVLVASFDAVDDTGDPSFGGVYNPLLGNGGDRSLWELVANPFGAFKDNAGNDLLVGSTLGISNSDFQSDVAGSGPFQYNPTSYTCGRTTENFCGTESGQFRLANEIPEPGSMVLLGLGMLGIGAFRRSTRKLSKNI